MTNLDDITLLVVLGPGERESLNLVKKILDDSKDVLSFKKTKIFANRLEVSPFDDSRIEVIRKAPKSIQDYNIFCMNSMAGIVDTEFALTFQTDGFIVNPHLWSDDFLNYDYIGAPWPDNSPSRVGNGGFSLRSRRFMEISQGLKYLNDIGLPYGHTPEDHLLCRYYYEIMIEKGIKFAPLDKAIEFSFEQFLPEFPDWDNSKSFGFHGLFQAGWENDPFRSSIKKKYYDL